MVVNGVVLWTTVYAAECEHGMCLSSEVGVGRSSTEPVRGGQLPSVLPTDPWDGKDGEV